MTIKMIKGSTVYNRVPYYAGTSQAVIENVDETEGQYLINSGFVVKVPDPPKPPLQIFTESPEKIRNKIAELETKLAESQKEKAALLDDDLQDVAGITKKIDLANGRVSSLLMLIERQQAKLKKAEENEEREKEKAAVKKLERATAQYKTEAEKLINDILSAVANLETKHEALLDLRKRVRDSFYADEPRMYLKINPPLLRALDSRKIGKTGLSQ